MIVVLSDVLACIVKGRVWQRWFGVKAPSEASRTRGGGWGGGRALNKVLYGEALPRGPNPYPFIYHFDRKGTLSIHLP